MFHRIQGVSQEGKFAFGMIWKIKQNWGSEEHCESLSGFSKGPGAKALGNSLKLVWYSLLEIIKQIKN